MNFSTQGILQHSVLLCCRKNVLLSWSNVLAFGFIWSFVFQEFTLRLLHLWLQIGVLWDAFFISFQITSCMIMWGKVSLNTVKPFPSDLKMNWVQYLKISVFCKIWKREFGCSYGARKAERKDSLVFPYKSNYFPFLPLHSSTAITGKEKGKEKKRVWRKSSRGFVQGQSES